MNIRVVLFCEIWVFGNYYPGHGLLLRPVMERTAVGTSTLRV